MSQGKTNPIVQLTQALSAVGKAGSGKATAVFLQLKPGRQPPVLEVRCGDWVKAYPLLKPRLSIGRDPGCDIVIDSPLISGHHATLEWKGRRGRLRDENSTNKMYKRGRKILETPLRHGDRVSLAPPDKQYAATLRFLAPPPWPLQALQIGVWITGSVLGLAIAAIAWEVSRVPAVRPLPVGEAGPIRVLAADGTEIGPGDRPPRSELNRLEDFGPWLPKAVMASEDRWFYWHPGVDPLGTLRAIVTNVRSGELREGGSTITQQLARNLLGRSYVGTGDTAGRKWREMAAAIKLSLTYSKDEILRHYLNRVYLGNGAYGFQDGALLYFGKPARDLTLSEAAALVGALPAPNRLNPFRNKTLNLEYRNRVLNRMVELGMVSAAEGERARRSILQLNERARTNLQGSIAPYFYGRVLDELYALEELLAEEGGLIVETGLNLSLQKAATQALQQTLAREGTTANISQGAIAVVGDKGQILALVGGADYTQSQFDRATQARRQPGSTFKLFAYGAALQQGISPHQTFSCGPVAGVAGCRRGVGAMNMYDAMAFSENAVAIRVAQAAGWDNVIRLARQLGIDDPLAGNANLALGGYETSVLKMAAAYQTVVADGVYFPPLATRRVFDSRDCLAAPPPQSPDTWATIPAKLLPHPQAPAFCRVILDVHKATGTPVLTPAIAQTLQELLAGVVRYGTGRDAQLPGAIGKTGTTDGNRDLWFVGSLVPQKFTAAVWLGNDEGVTSGSSAIAAATWGNLMQAVTQ